MRSTSVYLLPGTAIFLWAAAFACMAFTLDPADRLPGIIPVMIGIMAACATVTCGQRWMMSRIRDELVDIVDAYLAARLVPQAFRDYVPPAPRPQPVPAAAVPITLNGHARDIVPDHIYWPVYGGVTDDVLSENDDKGDGAPAVQ